MYAEIEQRILDRLRAKIPDQDGQPVTIEPLREIERVPEMRQKAPAVWVIYDGFTPGDSIPSMPHVQQVRLEWFVVVAAKSAKGAGDVEAARDMASALAERVMKALLGFHAGGGQYLRLGDAPGPEYDAGYCHVPLAFTCAATFKGQP
jgi:phage gp37-like protein